MYCPHIVVLSPDEYILIGTQLDSQGDKIVLEKDVELALEIELGDQDDGQDDQARRHIFTCVLAWCTLVIGGIVVTNVILPWYAHYAINMNSDLLFTP
jgi:hypothetical protein